MVDVTRGAERGKGGEAPSSYSKGCSAPLRGRGQDPNLLPAQEPAWVSRSALRLQCSEESGS